MLSGRITGELAHACTHVQECDATTAQPALCGWANNNFNLCIDY